MRDKKLMRFSLALLVLLVLSVLPAYAAGTVDGFMEIPWGASAAQVRQAMANYTFAENYAGSFGNRNSFLIFRNGGYFANYKAYEFRIDLMMDKMVQGYVIIPAGSREKGWAIYNDLRSKLQGKYGPPEAGNPDAQTVWLVANGNKKPCRIDLMLQFSQGGQFPGSVIVAYRNEALVDELETRQGQNY